MKWISIEERLPKKGIDVLVYGFHSIDIAFYDTKEDNKPYWVRDDGYELDFYAITHWMKLPNPPKKEK
jgi:hypothetical protein